MSIQIRRLGAALAGLAVAFGCGVGSSGVEASDRAETYSVGVVPQFSPDRLQAVWRPVLDAVEAQVGVTLELGGPPQIAAFEEELYAGQFDFAYANPYQAAQANVVQGYLPLVRDGERSLSGILVVHRDSPIEYPSDLTGREVAFPAPNAFGATLMLRTELVQAFATRVAPVYVHTHSSVYLHVAMGLMAAGGGVVGTLRAAPQEIRDSLRVLYQTNSSIAHPVIAHPRVPSEIREAVGAALIAFSATEEGAAAMAGIPMPRPVATDLTEYEGFAQWDVGALEATN